ncbi:antibiotic biosynthesis monooxygenase family protein [Amycolatopsis nigrescens]|uniref:antibiotic biosynthesis monooxygenase family protein n=1 Tax=Amycolatopsis nigrescens TaxID=381445 RepID=UPI000362BADE|nr:antibiotic biosynthesis monooxygenase family protein [Amycolatopsis nigrescens]
MSEQNEETRARVIFMFTVPAARTEDFLRAYDKIRYEVAGGVPGHILDQVCQSAADPEQWLITSEWDSIEHFEQWERSPDHRTLVRPLRECMESPKSLRFTIRMQTARGDALSLAGLVDAVQEK